MTNETTDLTFKTRLIAAWAWLQRAYAWCGGHQVAAAIGFGLLTGFILGKVL